MSGKKVTELNIANNLVDKIAELLDAEVHHSLLVDYKGNAERKISIIYNENYRSCRGFGIPIFETFIEEDTKE